MRRGLIFAISGLLANGVLLFGQTGQVTGRVTDPTEAVVPNASIVVTNLDTKVRMTATTNASGYYTVPALPPGLYEIAVQKEGFKTIHRTGMRLFADDKLRLDFTLEMGSVDASITVTEDAPLLRADSGEGGGSITDQEYDRLPLLQINRNRNPTAFIYLVPGVQGQLLPDGTQNTAATNQIQIHGSQVFTNEVMVDGIAGGQTGNIGSFTEMAPPVDAIKEFKVQSSAMSAEFGRSGAGMVNFTTKSGTSQFHGTAFDYLRNDALDSRNWFAAARPQTRQNEFGFTLGGPFIIPLVSRRRDRTFFFLAYDGARKRGGETLQRIQIPTPQQIAGDFRNTLNASGQPVIICDPDTTRSGPSGTFVRDPFPNNSIPTQRMDPVVVKIAKFIPQPNTTGVGGINYQGPTGEEFLSPNTVTTKIDHVISDKQRVWGSLTWNGLPRLTLYNPLPQPIGQEEFQEVTSRTVRLTHDYFVRPTVLNEFSAGLNRFRNPMAATSIGQDWPQKLGLTGMTGDMFPVISFSDGLTGFGRAASADNIDQTYIVKDSLSWTQGKHNLKFGVEHRRNQLNNRDASSTGGSASFTNALTNLPGVTGAAGGGYGFASFLLGYAYSGSMNIPFNTGPRRHYSGFYVQDDFHVTKRLTLGIGLRYEFEAAPWEANNQYGAIDLGVPNPAANSLPGAFVIAGSGPGRTGSRTLTDTDYSGVGPRFSFAWQVGRKTVVRGGYGIYYSANYLQGATDGFRPSGSYTNPNAGISPAFRLQDGFPDFARTVTLTPIYFNGRGGTVFEGSSGAMPRTQNTSVMIQRALGANLVLEAGYVGNHNTRQIAAILVNINQLDPKYLALGPLLSRQITSAEAQAAGIQAPFPGFTGSIQQSLRPYPQYTTLSVPFAKAGNSVYHSFQLRLKKRLSAGLSADMFYTISKNLGYVSSARPGYFGATVDVVAAGQDTYNRKLDRAILNTDVPQALQITCMYDLPFGKSRRFLNGGGLVNKLAGGWSLSGVQRYQSGAPVAVNMNNNLPLYNNTLRPDRVLGQKASTGISNADFNPYRDRLVNPAAFSAPAAYHFGTAAPTMQDLRLFPVFNEDASVTKRTVVTERVSVETYGQFLNLFNRHRFGRIAANWSSSTFGTAGQASLPRMIQLGLRFRF